MEALWRGRRAAATVPSIGGRVTSIAIASAVLLAQRIEQLVDPTAVVELHPLAGWGSEFPIGCGTVNAIGVVSAPSVRSTPPT